MLQMQLKTSTETNEPLQAKIEQQNEAITPAQAERGEAANDRPHLRDCQ